MLRLHLTSELALALAASAWGLSLGLSVWAVLGLYLLGGTLGLLGSAAGQLAWMRWRG